MVGEVAQARVGVLRVRVISRQRERVLARSGWDAGQHVSEACHHALESCESITARRETLPGPRDRQATAV